MSLLKDQLKKGMVTLVYDAKDEKHNEALVLKAKFQGDGFFLPENCLSHTIKPEISINRTTRPVIGTIST